MGKGRKCSTSVSVDVNVGKNGQRSRRHETASDAKRAMKENKVRRPSTKISPIPDAPRTNSPNFHVSTINVPPVDATFSVHVDRPGELAKVQEMESHINRGKDIQTYGSRKEGQPSVNVRCDVNVEGTRPNDGGEPRSWKSQKRDLQAKAPSTSPSNIQQTIQSSPIPVEPAQPQPMEPVTTPTKLPDERKKTVESVSPSTSTGLKTAQEAAADKPSDEVVNRHVRIEIPAQTGKDTGQHPQKATGAPFYLENPDACPTYVFGTKRIPSGQVFLRTFLSYAFVNIKPALRGHMLVAPMRCVRKLKHLTETEAVDLFRTVRLVNRVLEKYFGVNSSTITIQDGPAAGQSVKHVHVHIIPRSKKDMNTRELYAKLAEHEKKKPRPLNEMIQEATAYRQLFYKHGPPDVKNSPKRLDPELAGNGMLSPIMTFAPSIPSSTITPSARPSPTEGDENQCECAHCRKIQCPECQGKKQDTKDARGAFWFAPAAKGQQADAESPQTNKGQMKGDQESTSKQRVTSVQPGPSGESAHVATKPSLARTAFACGFVGAMGLGVMSVVKQLR